MQAKGIIHQETMRFKGEPVQVDAVRVENQLFILSGNLVRTASLKKDRDEWMEDVAKPDEVIQALKNCPARVDLFKFWQRIPETERKYEYYTEWRDIAAIPITTYKRWWEKQVSPSVRNKIRKAQKLGVMVGQVECDDEFVRGVMGIYNQSPVRRGKRFWHYGRSFDSVKEGMSTDANRAIFIAAHYKKELIGFIKLLVADRYAMIVLILDKTLHRDKAPMNGMMAKAVEICADRKIPYITYTVWRRGDHGKFQESNGFEKISVPEYYVPITLSGTLALRLGLHKGLRAALPEPAKVWLLELRRRWYALKLRQETASPNAKAEPATVSSN